MDQEPDIDPGQPPGGNEEEVETDDDVIPLPNEPEAGYSARLRSHVSHLRGQLDRIKRILNVTAPTAPAVTPSFTGNQQGRSQEEGGGGWGSAPNLGRLRRKNSWGSAPRPLLNEVWGGS